MDHVGKTSGLSQRTRRGNGRFNLKSDVRIIRAVCCAVNERGKKSGKEKSDPRDLCASIEAGVR